MAKFAKVTEFVLRNSGGELSRVPVETLDVDCTGYSVAIDDAFREISKYGLSVGDTITIEEREEEIE